MTLRPQFSLGHSEFNGFLFASVGEEKNGMQLTVLSALTRLGLDPWGEAARLSKLPRESAARALALVIALLPEGDWTASDSWAIATRLVKCLPAGDAPAAVQPAQIPGNSGTRKKPGTALWVVYVVFAATLFFAVSRLQADHTPGPAPNHVSSIQR
jgi:hypothetical protein